MEISLPVIDPPRPISNFKSAFLEVSGIQLHYWTGGPADGQPILLWHGFLETSYVWRKVAERLADAGYSVLIPDMRGFGDSDKPPGLEGYDAAALASECHDLVKALSFGQGQLLTIAAHDMGAPPALLYAARFAHEVKGLIYLEGPVMLADVLQKIISYDREAMTGGSMWWWILPLAPDVPERLIVGREREFLTRFHGAMAAQPEVVEEALDEYLRTFRGKDGVLGAMGVYRAAFTSISQTTPLTMQKVVTPVIAVGGRKSLAEKQGEMVRLVASNVEVCVLENGGHFLPEECDAEVTAYIHKLASRASR